ncbi:MAG: hypothetical protein WCF98_06490 [Synechococcus sp. ELA057]
MSWAELERLVNDAEAHAELRDTLSRCRSTQQQLLCALAVKKAFARASTTSSTTCGG